MAQIQTTSAGQPLPAHVPGAIQALLAWYAAHRRQLPWREEPTPYRVWVSEIMLQQTQVATVIPYFEAWMRQFSDVEALARATEQEVLERWSGLGYYRRARSLRAGAQKIVADGMPTSRDGWLEIPGVGPYTAGAIASIALGETAPIVDGNVERVLSRLLVLRASQAGSAALHLKSIWAASEEWLGWAVAQGHKPGDFNQALMELGARVCTPVKPDCSSCPLRSACKAFAGGWVSELPEPKKKPEVLRVQESRCLVWDEKGRVLVSLSQDGSWRQGLWDLPESFEGSVRWLGSLETRHVVTRHRIERTTRVGVVSAREGGLPKLEGSQWVHFPVRLGPGQKLPVPVGSAFRKTLERARERFA